MSNLTFIDKIGFDNFGFSKNARQYVKGNKSIKRLSGEDFCVACGEYVPEGMQVCPACRKRYKLDDKKWGN